MARTALDCVSPAFEHMQRMLFRPFRFALWVRLAVLGLLTGELGSSGGCNFNFPTNFPAGEHGEKEFLAAPHWPDFLHDSRVLAFVVLLLVCAVLLMLVMTYVTSVCRFILFDSVLTRRVALRAGWTRWQPQAARFFLFQLLLMAATLVVVVIPVIVIAVAALRGSFGELRDHVARSALGIAGLVVILVCFFVVLAFVTVLTKDFVVPQMALGNTGVLSGWQRLIELVRTEPKRWAGYVGMKIVLAIAAGVMLTIVWVFLFLIVLVPVLIIAIIVALAAKGATVGWTAVTIALAVMAGMVLVALLIFTLGLAGAPVTVFFPAYSMYFFADRYPPLAALLYPPPPARPMEPEPALAPPEPPPLPA